MLESRTPLQQRREYAQLEPHWSAAMERRGDAPGLSSYVGRSSIWHSVDWERAEEYERRKQVRDGARPRGPSRRPATLKQRGLRRTDNGSRDAEVFVRLKKGCSYGAIMRELDVSMGVVRRVAKLNGMDRSMFRSGVRA